MSEPTCGTCGEVKFALNDFGICVSCAGPDCTPRAEPTGDEAWTFDGGPPVGYRLLRHGVHYGYMETEADALMAIDILNEIEAPASSGEGGEILSNAEFDHAVVFCAMGEGGEAVRWGEKLRGHNEALRALAERPRAEVLRDLGVWFGAHGYYTHADRLDDMALDADALEGESRE